jgi:hypothetical protein
LVSTQLRPARLQRHEQLPCARQERDILEHVPVPKCPVNRQRLRHPARPDQPLDRDFDSAAHRASDLRHGRRRQAEGRHGVRVRAVDRPEMVD